MLTTTKTTRTETMNKQISFGGQNLQEIANLLRGILDDLPNSHEDDTRIALTLSESGWCAIVTRGYGHQQRMFALVTWDDALVFHGNCEKCDEEITSAYIGGVSLCKSCMDEGATNYQETVEQAYKQAVGGREL